MFILKLLLKAILLPIFLMVCFVKTWAEVLSKIGCIILGLFYIVMLAIIIMYVSKQMWGAVVISVVMSFVAFMIAFSTMAAGMVLDKISDKISELLTL